MSFTNLDTLLVTPVSTGTGSFTLILSDLDEDVDETNPWGSFFKNLSKEKEAAPLAKKLRVLVHPDKYKSEEVKKEAQELTKKKIAQKN